MYFSYTFSILLTLPSIYSVSISAQALTQNQTCANACTAAQACDHQCVPGTGNDPYVNTDIYNSCLCQSGCLCNAEICLQCCEAAGNNDPEFQSCPFIQLAAGNVLAYCTLAGSTPAKATPAKACFVYGDGENGSPISTYASNSPFPSSVETFISGLLPLTNITIAASSLISGQAETTSSSSPTTGVTGSTPVSSQTTAKADTKTTTLSSQAVGKTAPISPSPLAITTSAPTSITAQSSITVQPITSSPKSAVERTRPPMAAKGFFILLLALRFGLGFL